MIHDKKTMIAEAHRIANENGAPVWVEYDVRFGAYIIHETPFNIRDNVYIVPPEERGKV